MTVLRRQRLIPAQPVLDAPAIALGLVDLLGVLVAALCAVRRLVAPFAALLLLLGLLGLVCRRRVVPAVVAAAVDVGVGILVVLARRLGRLGRQLVRLPQVAVVLLLLPLRGGLGGVGLGLLGGHGGGGSRGSGAERGFAV